MKIKTLDEIFQEQDLMLAMRKAYEDKNWAAYWFFHEKIYGWKAETA